MTDIDRINAIMTMYAKGVPLRRCCDDNDYDYYRFIDLTESGQGEFDDYREVWEEAKRRHIESKQDYLRETLYELATGNFCKETIRYVQVADKLTNQFTTANKITTKEYIAPNPQLIQDWLKMFGDNDKQLSDGERREQILKKLEALPVDVLRQLQGILPDQILLKLNQNNK